MLICQKHRISRFSKSLSLLRLVLAVCRSALQCVAVYYSALQRVAVCCSVLQCVVVYSVLQCVAVCCTVAQTLSRVNEQSAYWCDIDTLMCTQARTRSHIRTHKSGRYTGNAADVLNCVAVCCRVFISSCCCIACVAMCCNVLQCVAMCCNVLQCVAVFCSVLQCVAVTR